MGKRPKRNEIKIAKATIKDESIDLKTRLIGITTSVITFPLAVIGLGIGIPYSIIGYTREVFLPYCNNCKQQKTRHLSGWDGGKIVCGNPNCSESTKYMTIRSCSAEKKKYKDSKWKNAYNREEEKRRLKIK